jgi:hypothetical protein
MKLILRLALLALVAALGCWLWTVLFPGPETLIRRKIAGLAAAATFGAGDSTIARAGKAASLAGFFAADAEITLDAAGYPARTFSGRDEIREAALGGFASLPALKADFLDVTVRLGADQQTADVSCTARVFTGDSKDYNVQEMRFQLRQVDGAWLITRAETVKTLSWRGDASSATVNGRNGAPPCGNYLAVQTSRKPSSVRSGATAEISGSFAAISFA